MIRHCLLAGISRRSIFWMWRKSLVSWIRRRSTGWSSSHFTYSSSSLSFTSIPFYPSSPCLSLYIYRYIVVYWAQNFFTYWSSQWRSYTVPRFKRCVCRLIDRLLMAVIVLWCCVVSSYCSYLVCVGHSLYKNYLIPSGLRQEYKTSHCFNIFRTVTKAQISCFW